jgi:orotate phosphoribosyltransferase
MSMSSYSDISPIGLTGRLISPSSTTAGTMLSEAERAAHWEWCREFIDRQAIWRATPEQPGIPGKAKGSTYVWQFYLRRATLNPTFAGRLALLFWDQFGTQYDAAPFQIGACAPSGIPIGCAIQAARPVNLFVIRREPKSFGFDNWFDGRILPDVPVLLVDDLAASAPFLLLASARVQQRLGLPLHRCYFTVVNKVGRGFSKASQHTENYLDNQLISLFTMNNFCRTAADFKERYSEAPKWEGIVA